MFPLGEKATPSAGLTQAAAVTTNALGQAAVTVKSLTSGAAQLQVSVAFQGYPPGTETRREHGIVSEEAERIEPRTTFHRR